MEFSYPYSGNLENNFTTCNPLKELISGKKVATHDQLETFSGNGALAPDLLPAPQWWLWKSLITIDLSIAFIITPFGAKLKKYILPTF